MNLPVMSTRLLEWLVLAALFAVAIGSRWTLIAQHGVPVPFHDQWSAEGEAIFEPWFAGELGWEDFLKPSNEHRPALTRLLAFAEFRLTGQWNTRLQMLVNSLFYALTAVALSLHARAVFSPRGWVAATAAIAFIFALQGNYENAVWGYQSQFYLMVLLGVVYLGGTFSAARIDARWVAAQAAGALGLVAMAGGTLAPIAVAVIAFARLVHRRHPHAAATLVSAIALALLGWWMLPASVGDGPLQVRSAVMFVEALLKLLAWPSPIALAAALIHLPWLLVAVRTLLAREGPPGDRVFTVLGGWVLLQAMAIAWSRGGSFSEIPPRYFDILVVGLVVNGLCLATLIRDHRRRAGSLVFGGAWLVAVSAGLWHSNRPARMDPILETNSALHHRTLEVVRDYISTGDAAVLQRDPFVAHHFPSIATMRRLLDNPGIRASLPSTVRGDPVPTATERFTDGVPGSWPWLLGIAGTAFAVAAGAAVVRSRGAVAAAEPVAPIPWFTTAGLLAVTAVALVAAGMRPWDTNPQRRLARILDAAGEPVAGFEVPGAAGGIFAFPGASPSLLFGTYLGGDGYTGEFISSEFPVDKPFLVVPVTGYPNGRGNSLRIDFILSGGAVRSTTVFRDGNPGEAVYPWMIGVPANTGDRARLVLVDGSTEWRGWLGAGTPRLTDDATAARRAGLALETVGAESARRFPAVLLAASALCAVAGSLARRRDLASAAAP